MASTTTTMASTTTAKDQNPMKSTWRTANRESWTFVNRAVHNIDPARDLDRNSYPVFSKTDSVPYLTQSSVFLYVSLHAIWPIAVHHLYFLYFNRNPPVLLVFFFYAIALQSNSVKQMKIIQDLGLKYGYLDGDKHARDDIPDVGVGKVLTSLLLAITFRPLIALVLAYDPSKSQSISWALPVQLALYAIILDFFFYVYHRGCHEIGVLWKYHRTHHLTKHPTPMLTLYADGEQEFIEVVLIPVLTFLSLKALGLPLTFYDWWICNAFVMFSELWGHSGLRVRYVATGTASLVLQFFDSELITEDHDLHHRKGWKKAESYGKQTRLWDRVFGTGTQRIEMADANVDWNRPITMPFFASS